MNLFSWLLKKKRRVQEGEKHKEMRLRSYGNCVENMKKRLRKNRRKNKTKKKMQEATTCVLKLHVCSSIWISYVQSFWVWTSHACFPIVKERKWEGGVGVVWRVWWTICVSLAVLWGFWAVFAATFLRVLRKFFGQCLGDFWVSFRAVIVCTVWAVFSTHLGADPMSFLQPILRGLLGLFLWGSPWRISRSIWGSMHGYFSWDLD